MDIAFDTFGKRGGLAMFNAIKNGTLDINKMAEALSNATGTIDETYEHMETLGEFISRKWNGAIADFVQWNNEGFWATKQLIDEVSNRSQPLFDFVDNWATAIKRTIKGETERRIENGNVIVSLNEKGKAVDKEIAKEENLKEVNDNYVNSLDVANEALRNFDAISIDDSKTRAEFEVSKNVALATADAFRAALQEKILYTQGQMVGLPMVSAEYAKLSKDLAALTTQAIKAESIINRVKNTAYTGTGKGGGNNNNNNKKPSGGSSKTNVVEQKKEELKALRDLKIQEVQDSVE